MSQMSLAAQIAGEIRSLAQKAADALPASSPGGSAARRAMVRPVDYMRYAEFEAILRDLVVNPDMRVLDISSPQWFSLYLAHKYSSAKITYTNFMVSELDPFRAIAEALQITNLTYRKADARALEFDDNTFDRVISISVIEHIDPEVGGDAKTLKEIARVLKPAGQLLLTVPYKAKRNIVYVDEPVYERNEKKHNFFAREYDKQMFDQLIDASAFALGSAWFVCEKRGMLALDYYEWGPGRDVPAFQFANKVRRRLERSLGKSLDGLLAHRYLEVSRDVRERVVNIAARLTKA